MCGEMANLYCLFEYHGVLEDDNETNEEFENNRSEYIGLDKIIDDEYQGYSSSLLLEILES